MANNDRVHEAYNGLMGENFRKMLLKRIEWILNNVGVNKKVLDAGCSQGIISILIAREGNDVTGIDIQKEAISYAESILQDEYKDVKDKVDFYCMPFESYNSEDEFDCIVMTEVIEHLEKPLEFLKNAESMLHKDGKVIVTVPFGYSNHHDHYTTFYTSDFVELIDEVFEIQNISYLEGWMGIVATPKVDRNKQYTLDLSAIKEEEEAFYNVHKKLSEQAEQLRVINDDFAEKYRLSVENYGKVKKWHENSVENYEKVKKLHKDSVEKNNELKEFVLEAYYEINDMQLLLNEVGHYIKRIESKNAYLRAENDEYCRKLAKITDTWYGKLAIKLYKLLQRTKRKFMR